MTQLSRGFFLERLAAVGPGVDIAAVDLRDGLNIVAGASDTGKSYLCSLVDFVFGASKPPRAIPQAKQYTHVVARLRDRRSGDGYEIERTLTGGDALVRRLDNQGTVLEERVAAAAHSAENTTTLSSLLLGLSGFTPGKVRKNKWGETRSLSFRDVAFLVVVDETRIISEGPPHLSGNPVEKTAEGEVLRFLVTGIQSVEPFAGPRRVTVQNAKAQHELMLQLIGKVESELKALQLGSSSIDEELLRLDQAHVNLLNTYESSRIELVELENALAKRSRLLHDAESRLIVIEGLMRRFELLDHHYESDIERLSAIEEAGVMLDALPAGTCPVCGAAPEDHRPDQAAMHFRVDDIRQAAVTEQNKIGRLRADLCRTLSELSQEAMQLEDRRTTIQGEVKHIQANISGEVQPRMHASAEQLHAQTMRRDTLLRARVLTEQLRELRSREAQLQALSKSAKAIPSVVDTTPTTGAMEIFAQRVEDILNAWRFPEMGRVVFSEDSQDLIIGGEPRASHGKGVRALTCSAFVAGVMLHCLRKGLAHPGIIAIDSPLVAYKAPDSEEDRRILQAGVKNAFYRTLADGLCIGQVLVFENEDPPPDVAERVAYHHFTKGPYGRYGFFPVRKPGEDPSGPSR
jgi:hypothetical protein